MMDFLDSASPKICESIHHIYAVTFSVRVKSCHGLSVTNVSYISLVAFSFEMTRNYHQNGCFVANPIGLKSEYHKMSGYQYDTMQKMVFCTILVILWKLQIVRKLRRPVGVKWTELVD